MKYKEFWEKAKSHVDRINKDSGRPAVVGKRKKPDAPGRIRDWDYRPSSFSFDTICMCIPFGTKYLTSETYDELEEKASRLGLKIAEYEYEFGDKIKFTKKYNPLLELLGLKRKVGTLDDLNWLKIDKDFEQGGELLESVMEIKPSKKQAWKQEYQD